MNPKTCISCLFLAAAAFGSNVGDTYQQVLAEKGAPKSQIEAGAVRILNYPDATIKLRDNIVQSVGAAAKSTPHEPAPSPIPSPAVKLAAIENELIDTITKVQNIINQPAAMAQRTPQMRVWEYETWFHPGSSKPDFSTVDVQNTQEFAYDGKDFVCLKAHPDLVWAGSDLEFNSMTKFFYVDRSIPKKRLTSAEMLEINRLYRIIGRCERALSRSGIVLKPSS